MSKVLDANETPATPAHILNFEVWMMRSTLAQLDEWDAKDGFRESNLMLYIAVFEAFLVHVRGLLEFFHKRRSSDSRCADDLRPDNFLPSTVTWRHAGVKVTDVEEWIELINKRLQHITSSRTSTSKDWPRREMRDHIMRLVDELNRLTPNGEPITGERHPGLAKKGA